MGDYKDIKEYVEPVNRQVVILKDEGASETSGGVLISEGARAKFKSGTVVAFAKDCVNPLFEGGRVGYQLHAGTDMQVQTEHGVFNIMTLNETSITMLLKNNARLGGGS
jgi:co-chaperonin GroES (HSP10)